MIAALRWHEAPRRVQLAALSLPIVLVTTLLRALGLIDDLALLGYAALLVYVLAEWPRLPRINRLLLWIAFAALVLLPLLHPQPLSVLRQAFDRAAYYATFVTALSFLREAAATSKLVRECGYRIINQPPAKRYLTLSSGSLLFGIILNIGAINLLGVMTSRSNTLRAAGGNREIQQARGRRMTLALLRGFSLTPLASPFSITLVVVLSSFPELRWHDVLPLGFLAAALLLGYGWWLDRRNAPRHLRALVPPLDTSGGWGPQLRFLALVLGIVGVAIGLELLLRIPLVLAILLSAPPMGLLWMAAQRRRHGALKALHYASVRLGRRSLDLFPSLRSEVGILGGAGFTGVLLAAMLPPDLIANALQSLHLSGPLAAIFLMALVVLGSNVGLNPIVSVTLLAAALPDPRVLDVAPALMGLAYMCSWALAINFSPLTASVLLLSRLAGVPPAELGYRWNGRYTLGSFALLSLLLVLLGWVL
ncbi:MAG: hypothetical protein GX093_02445 [Xanthomonadaceae bacterium]|nr:hypothetical protein [Xanthomonadaceae bacterium]